MNLIRIAIILAVSGVIVGLLNSNTTNAIYKRLIYLITSLLILSGITLGFNSNINSAAQRAVKNYANMAVIGHYQWGFNKNVAVFDIREIKDNVRHVQIQGAFMRFADQLKDHKFDKVIFASGGINLYEMNGNDFQKLGAEYSWQKPLVLLFRLNDQLKPLY